MRKNRVVCLVAIFIATLFSPPIIIRNPIVSKFSLVLPRDSFLVNYSLHGGWRGGFTFEERGFFYLTEWKGSWWLVDPSGNLFISKGVNHIDPYGDYSPSLGYSPYERNVNKKYGRFEEWLKSTVTRLKFWGFNTIGAWSYRKLSLHMPYTVILYLMTSYRYNSTVKIYDIFDSDFEHHVKGIVLRECIPRVNDSLLLGYFLDNELKWGPKLRSNRHLLDDFIKLSSRSPGKKIAIKALLKAFDNNVEKLSIRLRVKLKSLEGLLRYSGSLPIGGIFDKARSIFLRYFAERYFNVSTSIIRAYDPNHLILGVRFVWIPPVEVLEVARKYLDVISINIYTTHPPLEALEYVYNVTRRPIMITEFSFKAVDSGLPNTKGAGEPTETQLSRAYLTAKYALKIIELPYVIGYHWFQYTDQPKEGRFDGENSNFGLVKIDDEPWRTLVSVFTLINSKAELVHAKLVKADTVLKKVNKLLAEIKKNTET